MTQRPDGYRKYESDAIFDALEAFESRGGRLAACRWRGSRSRGCSACPR